METGNETVKATTGLIMTGQCPHCNIEFKILAKDHPTNVVAQKVCGMCESQYQFRTTVQSWKLYGKEEG